MDFSVWAWVLFHVLILGMLVIDLALVGRGGRISLKTAAVWSVVWTAVALAFNGLVLVWRGSEDAVAFLTAYIIERALSFDNVFVFAVIFNYFQLAPLVQHTVLFLGILVAIILRAVFILFGIELIHHFHWTVYVFGAFLIYTGIRLALHRGGPPDPETSTILRLARRFIPVKVDNEAHAFFVKVNGRWYATPAFLALLLVESTDVVFAIDSVPAVLAVTTDAFIAYTSNILAVLGMRALYFLVVGLLRELRYLDFGLAVVLVYIGLKMLAAEFFHIPTGLSLAVVLGVILGSAVLSLYADWRDSRLGRPAHRVSDPAGGDDPAA
jgi:tellurite resistance protein TerC